MPPGAVCVLPLGIRDGIGETGRFEHRALADQMTHGKPIIGGFIARLPKTVLEQHLQAPVIGSLLRLSSGETLSEDALARDRDAIARGGGPFRYVVIHPDDKAPRLRDYVTSMLPVRLIANENGIELYRSDWRRCQVGATRAGTRSLSGHGAHSTPSGLVPTPAQYTTDSDAPSMPRSRSIVESASAIEQNGARPSRVRPGRTSARDDPLRQDAAIRRA